MVKVATTTGPMDIFFAKQKQGQIPFPTDVANQGSKAQSKSGQRQKRNMYRQMKSFWIKILKSRLIFRHNEWNTPIAIWGGTNRGTGTTFCFPCSWNKLKREKLCIKQSWIFVFSGDQNVWKLSYPYFFAGSVCNNATRPSDTGWRPRVTFCAWSKRRNRMADRQPWRCRKSGNNFLCRSASDWCFICQGELFLSSESLFKHLVTGFACLKQLLSDESGVYWGHRKKMIKHSLENGQVLWEYEVTGRFACIQSATQVSYTQESQWHCLFKLWPGNFFFFLQVNELRTVEPMLLPIVRTASKKSGINQCAQILNQTSRQWETLLLCL